MSTAPPPLARRLGTFDAVLIGLGSMVGAGVFAAFAPAAAAAGAWLMVGLLIAGLVAYANATSSAQLAAQYPSAGGTYLYGRERLGEWWGFLAGWGFVIGKTASLAAMALTFAAYTAPEAWQRPVAVTAVVVLAAVNYRGITRTAQLTRIVVTVVMVALAVSLSIAWAAGGPDPDRLLKDAPAGAYGVLQAAALLFFAFAGYARIATLAEEVRDPSRTIPRAVTTALAIALLVYALVGATLLVLLGPEATAESQAPVAAAVATTGWDWASGTVTVAAAAASLGALLALVAGVGRTAMAMARHGDLPAWLAAVHPRFRVPHRAEVAVAVVVSGLVVAVDLRGAIGFSAFGVLLYYLVANLAAWTQDQEHRRYPRALQGVGVVGCLALALAVPVGSLVGGLVVLALGVAYRMGRLRLASRTS